MVSETVRFVDVLKKDGQNLKKVQEQLLTAGRNATPDERSAAVGRIAALITTQDWNRAGLAATVCGALVEMGVDASAMADPIVQHLLPALRQIASQPTPQVVREVVPQQPKSKPGLL